jgi:hypothetical protein
MANETIIIYVLVETDFQRGKETRRNIGATTDLVEAECHGSQEPDLRGGGFVEFSFDYFILPAAAFQMGAETTALIQAVREFREVASPLNEYIGNMR